MNTVCYSTSLAHSPSVHKSETDSMWFTLFHYFIILPKLPEREIKGCTHRATEALPWLSMSIDINVGTLLYDGHVFLLKLVEMLSGNTYFRCISMISFYHLPYF